MIERNQMNTSIIPIFIIHLYQMFLSKTLLSNSVKHHISNIVQADFAFVYSFENINSK